MGGNDNKKTVVLTEALQPQTPNRKNISGP